jgi:hypothetical protein
LAWIPACAGVTRKGQLPKDAAGGQRPTDHLIYHWQGATCWWREVKGLTITVNSAANGRRWEDVWIDR